MLMKKPLTTFFGSSLGLAVAFQLAWLVISLLCILVGRPILSSLLPVNLVTLFAPVVAEYVTRTKISPYTTASFLYFRDVRVVFG